MGPHYGVGGTQRSMALRGDVFSCVLCVTDRRVNMDSGEKIERSQDILVEAFRRLIGLNHPQQRFLLAKVIQVSPSLAANQNTDEYAYHIPNPVCNLSTPR